MALKTIGDYTYDEDYYAELKNAIDGGFATRQEDIDQYNTHV